MVDWVKGVRISTWVVQTLCTLEIIFCLCVAQSVCNIHLSTPGGRVLTSFSLWWSQPIQGWIPELRVSHTTMQRALVVCRNLSWHRPLSLSSLKWPPCLYAPRLHHQWELCWSAFWGKQLREKVYLLKVLEASAHDWLVCCCQPVAREHIAMGGQGRVPYLETGRGKRGKSGYNPSAYMENEFLPKSTHEMAGFTASQGPCLREQLFTPRPFRDSYDTQYSRNPWRKVRVC